MNYGAINELQDSSTLVGMTHIKGGMTHDQSSLVVWAQSSGAPSNIRF